MVEVIHTPREKTPNDCLIVGDNIDEIVEYCLPKIIPKSRACYEKELKEDLLHGSRSTTENYYIFFVRCLFPLG